MKARGKNRRELIEILDKALVTKTRDEWMHILRHGGDFIYTVVNSIDDQADALVSRTSPMFFLRPNSAPNSGRFSHIEFQRVSGVRMQLAPPQSLYYFTTI